MERAAAVPGVLAGQKVGAGVLPCLELMRPTFKGSLQPYWQG